MSMTATDVDSICALVHDLCGLYLDESKSYLLESRLGQLLRDEECLSLSDLASRARFGDDHLKSRIVDAITTRETLFFRDGSPFEALKHKALPELIDAKAGTPFSRRLRIWSAACSTGQEPYSIAMTLRELILDLDAWDVSILATDISDAAVAQASRGEYARHEIERGLPPEKLERFFRPSGDKWRAKDELRALIRFERRNLLQSFVGLGPFDVVFCRNVAIYFKPEPRSDLFLRIADRLEPHGYLFVGSSESLHDIDSRFQPQFHCRSTFYQPNRSLLAARCTTPAR